MNWNDHSRIKNEHAFLSPSKYHWLNYDADKLITTFMNQQAVQRGTKLHQFACEAIELGIRLPKSKKTINAYVNDAIGFKLSPEMPLMYSYNCFGTADAIGYFPKDKFLRIHDLKTGVTPASMHQLEIYAALFFLEYGAQDIRLADTSMELRIYQNDEVFVENPEPEIISSIMDQIVRFDDLIEKIKQEV